MQNHNNKFNSDMKNNNTENLNKNIHSIVLKDKNGKQHSIKVSKALQFNIKIINKDEFIKSLKS
jgi:hypothetical protein